jgi:hypothetical protein
MVAVLTAGGIRARRATPRPPKAAVLTTATPRSAPTVPSTSRIAPTTSTTRAVATITRPRPKAPPPTTTSNPAAHRPDRATCLAVAAANHYRVVVGNETWLQQQLRALAARHMLAGPQYQALQIEEAQAQTEIAAQYEIDRSNCYLS